MALSSVIVMPSLLPGLDPGESVSFLADEDKPGSRKHPFEPEPALRVGGLRDRLGSVAAVEHFRADDRLSVGADDPAGEIAVGVDQHDLAEVMGLAELAGQLGMTRRSCPLASTTTL